MRVLHIDSGNLYGGVETFLVTLARESAAVPDMDQEFAVCFEGRLTVELERLRRPPHRLGAVRLRHPHSIVRARRALRDLLRREGYDVVVCHQPWASVVFASEIRAAGLPVVLWVHMAGNGRHWLERLARLTRPDLAVCNSRFSETALSGWLERTEIRHVYYPVSPQAPVDHRVRADLRAELRTDPADVVLVQVSRLESWKGQGTLLTALARLRDLPGWTCWIVGGAQRRSEQTFVRTLQSFVKGAGIDDRVRFAGERGDVAGILGAADVFCQPNQSPEPFGLALVEALQAGLPVVTSGFGGACEIVDGSCGRLIQPDDVDGLARVLRALIVDADLRARLGSAARARPDQICNAPRQMLEIQRILSMAASRGVPVETAVQVECP